jgi:uncharacterized damage-inducible protein DinB
LKLDATIALAKENISILSQAEKLIEDINDTLYTQNDIPPFQSGIGKHMRHVLDFYAAFLNPPGDITDYDDRNRSVGLETDRRLALQAIHRIIDALGTLQNADHPVESKNDDGGHRPEGFAYSRSSIGRELQFLASHTVHHFAMMAFILVQQGHTPHPDFGVAASTLVHWQTVGRPHGPIS